MYKDSEKQTICGDAINKWWEVYMWASFLIVGQGKDQYNMQMLYIALKLEVHTLQSAPGYINI